MGKEYLRRALNGTNQPISLGELPVYHDYMFGESYDILGNIKNKDEWITQNIKEKEFFNPVKIMLTDWQLFDGGWFIESYENKALYYYLTQIVYDRPNELDYLNF